MTGHPGGENQCKEMVYVAVGRDFHIVSKEHCCIHLTYTLSNGSSISFLSYLGTKYQEQQWNQRLKTQDKKVTMGGNFDLTQWSVSFGNSTAQYKPDNTIPQSFPIKDRQAYICVWKWGEFSGYSWELRNPAPHPRNVKYFNHRASIPLILGTLYKSKIRGWV